MFSPVFTVICTSLAFLGGYEIPKGTTVMPNLYAVHHDPRHWEEPEKFNPERFLDASGKLLPKPESWMPFSQGRRACLAESLAKPELQLLLAGLFRNLQIRMPDGVTANLTARVENFVHVPELYKIVTKDRL